MSDPGLVDGVDTALKERALDAAPIGIVISDPDRPDNPVIYANPSFEELTGYDESEVVGRNCRFLQGPETDPAAVDRLREGIAEATPVTVDLLNYRADGEPFWNRVTVAPIRDDDGAIANYVGFQVDVTARKEAEREVRRRQEQLEHLLSRIQGLLYDVTALLMRTASREETERAVCERLVETEPYTLALFGELDLDRDTVVVSTWAGDDGHDGDDGDDGFDGDLEVSRGDTHPVAEAIDAREVVVSRDPEVCEAFGPEVRSLAVAPLAYKTRVYGVLAIGASAPAVFDSRERVVVGTLGRTVSVAINAAESRRIIATDTVVQIELEVTDPLFFPVSLAGSADCRLDHQGTIDGREGSLSAFFSTTVAPDRLEDAAAGTAGVSGVTVVSETADGRLVEVALESGSILEELADRGASVTTLWAEDGVARLVLQTPQRADPRSVVEWFTATYPNSELVGYRERRRSPLTKGEFLEALDETLTDRQRAALEAAYYGGFYDDPRTVTGEELAALLDVSRATYHQHRRAAERKVFAEFLDR